MLPNKKASKTVLVLLNKSNQQQHMEADAAKRPEKFSATFLRATLSRTLFGMLFLATAIIFFSCTKNKWIEVDPAFSRYIDAYTTGIVSKTSAVRIQLANTASTTHTVGEEVKESLFDFSYRH